MRERRCHTGLEEFPVRYDKAVRAQSIRCRMELDGLYVPARAPWLQDLKAELLAFPTGNPGGSPEATRRAFNKRFLLDLARIGSSMGERCSSGFDVSRR